MTTFTTPISARVAAELCVHRGDLAEATRTIELALATAPLEHRADLEQALSWLDEIMPTRPSLVGEA